MILGTTQTFDSAMKYVHKKCTSCDKQVAFFLWKPPKRESNENRAKNWSKVNKLLK